MKLILLSDNKKTHFYILIANKFHDQMYFLDKIISLNQFITHYIILLYIVYANIYE